MSRDYLRVNPSVSYTKLLCDNVRASAPAFLDASCECARTFLKRRRVLCRYLENRSPWNALTTKLPPDVISVRETSINAFRFTYNKYQVKMIDMICNRNCRICAIKLAEAQMGDMFLGYAAILQQHAAATVVAASKGGHQK